MRERELERTIGAVRKQLGHCKPVLMERQLHTELAVVERTVEALARRLEAEERTAVGVQHRMMAGRVGRRREELARKLEAVERIAVGVQHRRLAEAEHKPEELVGQRKRKRRVRASDRASDRASGRGGEHHREPQLAVGQQVERSRPLVPGCWNEKSWI